MKKTITAIALFLSLIGAAQTQATITLLSLSPDTVYAGDSLQINFTFTAPTGGGVINQDQWYITSSNQGQIQGISYPVYYSLPKTANAPGDTTYHLKIKTLVTHGIGAGVAKVNNSAPVNFFFCCNITGIAEQDMDNNITPAYYDLMGNRITPTAGEIIIEQRGVKRRKIYIQN